MATLQVFELPNFGGLKGGVALYHGRLVGVASLD